MTGPSLKHTPEQKYEVTPLELFFDLVFAFALTVMVAGLIAVAVANKEVIAHPYGHPAFALCRRFGACDT